MVGPPPLPLGLLPAGPQAKAASAPPLGGEMLFCQYKLKGHFFFFRMGNHANFSWSQAHQEGIHMGFQFSALVISERIHHTYKQ